MPQTWKTVRVFISTFCDTLAEGDHLIKTVFPELRERMAQRHPVIVDGDLRRENKEAEANLRKVIKR
jgi:hypothetical protein